MFFRILFCVFFLFTIAAGMPGIHIGKDGTVGASWGGYSASAGLGGILGGAGPRGGLHAQAGTPDGHFAAAGLGGSVSDGAGPQGQLYSVAGQAPVAAQPVAAQPVAAQPVASYPAGGANSQASASASASAGSGYQGGTAPVYVNKRPSTFFDDIFNIPISTLGAVNQYLNNRNKVVAVPSRVALAQQPAQSGSNAHSSASASSAGASSSASSAASSGASGGIDNTIYHGYQKNPNYNDIFNIPISVLGAVNRFLNGK